MARRFTRRVRVAMLVAAGANMFQAAPVTAHDSHFHRALAVQALGIMGVAESCLSKFNQSSPTCAPPQGVSTTDWTEFLKAAAQSKAKLVKFYGIANILTATEPSAIAQIANAVPGPDGNIDDTHLEIKVGNSVPTNALLAGLLGATAAVVMPIYCACECIGAFFGLGGDDACDACGKALSNPLDFFDGKTLENLIPGIGDFTSSDYTGLWHFINMRPDVSNTFDDHQGMLYSQSGPFMPGSVDLLIMVGTDIAGLTIDPDKSDGVKRYQRINPGDAFPDGDSYKGSAARTDFDWQVAGMAHVPFSPVDNLALYGWTQWRENGRRVTDLGYPLHALGDATVPMHVSGSTSWGHRPFEDAYDRLMGEGRLRPDANRVLTRAFRFRKEILAWRAQGHAGDVPIRRMVREVAQHTLIYSLQKEQETFLQTPLHPWPYDDNASLAYLVAAFGQKESSIGLYHDRADAASLYLPLLEDGLGAQLAFLMSAPEYDPGTPVVTSDLINENNTIGDVTGEFAPQTVPPPPPPSPAVPIGLVAPGTGAVLQARSLVTTGRALPVARGGPILRGGGGRRVPPRRPVPADAQQAFSMSLRMNYAALARSFVAGKLTPIQYVQRVRDREEKTRAAAATPGYYAALLRGDKDGDLVPDDRDAQPATPPYAPTDARGTAVPDATDARTRGQPSGPTAREMAALFARAGILVSPGCEGQKQPPVPRLRALNSSLENRDLLFVVDQVSSGTASCPIYYEIDVRNAVTSDPPKVFTTTEQSAGVIFSDAENEDHHPQPGRIVLRAHGPAGTKPAVGSRKRAWDIMARGYPLYGRVRAMNAKGEITEWSDWHRFKAGSIAEP